MAAFVIIGPPNNKLLEAAIERNFARRYKLTAGQWVVAETNLTAQQVAEKIGLGGTSGSFAAFSIAGFYGYHDKPLWEWLTINSG